MKLTGGLRSDAPILVDRYMLVGTKAAGAAMGAAEFHGYGTGDSTIAEAGPENVELDHQPVSFTQFSSDRTSRRLRRFKATVGRLSFVPVSSRAAAAAPAPFDQQI